MSKPTTAELTTLSIAEAGSLMARGELTATALTEAFLARIEAVDHKIASFVTLTADRARLAAKQADMEMSRGLNRGPLHGIPIGLKDIYETEGVLTTGHSHLRADYVPSVDAETVRRLKAGGAVILGKLATHEFANGAMTPDQPFPPARNPWNTDYQPGGSSSGSGAASPPRSAWAPWAPTPADRSATRRVSAPRLASSRPTVWSAAAASFPCRSASTPRAHSPGRSKTTR
jgi:aspartyl-tRNA(Asn)/glutamyl-tRNA(Gln) amidotransferase subunit A